MASSRRTLIHILVAATISAVTLVANADDSWRHQPKRPSFIHGEILHVFHDGGASDLLTGGLGKSGLAGAVPTACLSATPSTLDLRTCAIYANYRALADMTASGGYGVLYGPNIDLEGNDTLGEGKIAGDEYLAYADNGSGRINVTMMVQIPANFDAANPCIVAAPSSGSRGVYGAIGTTGEWGLKRGCAVAYTDKGTGNGVHDLNANTINLITGERQDALLAGKNSNFTSPITESQRAAFNAAMPDRFAIKHAHSQLNPEKDWGEDVLRSIEFAFHVLNQKYVESSNKRARRITPENTLVIASSVSNGGGASLAAGELDSEGLIDAVVVSEPQVQPNSLLTSKLTIKRGETVIANHSKGLYDYVTLANLYQPCAALAANNVGAPGALFINVGFAQNRCMALKQKGLLSASTLADQATEAQAVLNANGWEPESNILGPSHYGLRVAPAVATTYANAHGRFSVLDNLCGFSYGATNAVGQPAPLPALNLVQVFATGNGVPPTNGINIINNWSLGGPLLDQISVSPSTGLQDYNADGAECLRNLFTKMDFNTLRVRLGVVEVKRNGNLHGKPTIIVHGRADNLIPVNHASRPYFGLNKMVEGKRSKLHYYEVTNAQHFEAFIGLTSLLGGYDTRFIPLHVYGVEALNMMYAHLKNGTPLAPSQLVRTIPRGGAPGAANPITAANTPPIQGTPAASDLITFSGLTVNIPD
jgi:hydroxybutyrate-dimer hydrolase